MKTLWVVALLILVCTMAEAQYYWPPTSAGGGGSGTVTSVSSANSRATVANPTTTPSITIVSAPYADSLKSFDTTNVMRKRDSTLYVTQKKLNDTASAIRASIPVVPTYKDTIPKAGVFTSLTAADSGTIWRVEQSGITIRSIKVRRVGGTGTWTVNATRLRSGTLTNLAAANFSTTAKTFTDDFEDIGTLQNNTLNIGDVIMVSVRAVGSGTAQEITIQAVGDRVKL